MNKVIKETDAFESPFLEKAHVKLDIEMVFNILSYLILFHSYLNRYCNKISKCNSISLLICVYLSYKMKNISTKYIFMILGRMITSSSILAIVAL